MARAGASMRSAYAHLHRLGLKYTLRGQPRIFHVYLDQDGARTQIGHYTLIHRPGHYTFYDGINLYPEHRHHWEAAMRAAIAQAGPGRYDYGWQWNPEPARDAELAAIPGVRIVSTRNILIQGIDFSNWPTWEAYYRDVSENTRRNAKKAEKLHADIGVVVVTGLATLAKVPALVAMRQAMYRRKNLPFNPLRIFAGYVLNILACPDQAMIALAVGDGRVLAIQNNVEFADFHYYLDGAAANDTEGGAWYLQLAMLRRAYEAIPNGKFLMGYTDLPLDDQLAEGLLRSRRSLRVTDWPTSLIRFEFDPAAAA
ncbi:MAG TPA: hypothetical protein VFW47_14500 [Phenylobacterium sp.]|nr:hypothetical protein [Phenylobacterium sp.]